MALSKDAEDYKAAELRLKYIQKIEKEEQKELKSKQLRTDVLEDTENILPNENDAIH